MANSERQNKIERRKAASKFFFSSSSLDDEFQTLKKKIVPTYSTVFLEINQPGFEPTALTILIDKGAYMTHLIARPNGPNGPSARLPGLRQARL